MTTGIIVCTIIQIISIIIFIIGIAKDIDEFIIIGVIFFFGNILLGWGLINSYNISKSEYKPADINNIEIIHTDHHVFVEYTSDDLRLTKTISFKKSRERIKDCEVEWFIKLDYNEYGELLSKNLSYKSIDKSDKENVEENIENNQEKNTYKNTIEK